MRRRFNTTGSFSVDKHYMVRLDDRLKKIKDDYVDYGSYFGRSVECLETVQINRGRQYGKTTTLKALKKYLSEEYTVISLDFQELGSAEFADQSKFACAFAKVFMRSARTSQLSDTMELLEPLAGVYDIKNLKLKLRPESEHQYNSPWNIPLAIKQL